MKQAPLSKECLNASNMIPTYLLDVVHHKLLKGCLLGLPAQVHSAPFVS